MFIDKLKHVKQALKKWSKERFEDLEKKITRDKNEYIYLESVAEENLWQEAKRSKWLEARKHWLELEEKKIGMEKQKAKVKWVVKGDENTKRFHAAIKYRERRNALRGVKSERG